MTEPLPHCFSNYKHLDLVCDGDPKSTDSDEIQQCAIKKLCKAFRDYLKNKQLEVDLFLKETDDGLVSKTDQKAFLSFCNKLASVKVERKNRRKDKRKKGPSPAAKRAIRETKKRKKEENRAALMEKFDSFTKKLLNRLPGMDFALAGSVPTPGKLYIKDRLKKSSYMSIFQRAMSGFDPLLVHLRFKPGNLTFDAFFTCELSDMTDVLSKETIRFLKPKERFLKNWKVFISGMDTKEMSLLAESIGKLMEAGVLGIGERK